MSKIGTCKWTYQIQNLWRIPFGPDLDYSHPHTPKPAEEHVTLPEGRYSCQWLDQYDRDNLPPPIRRYNGTFEIRAADCDACPHYQPASGWGQKA